MQKALYALLLIFLSNSFVFAQNEHLKKQINEIIRLGTSPNYKAAQTFVVGLVDKDSSFFVGFGDVNDQNSPNAVFETGSMTKIFTAFITQKWINEGKIKLDSSIFDYLDIPNKQKITIEQLLTHSSGLPRVPEGIGSFQEDAKQPYEFYSKENLKEFLENHPTNGAKKYLFAHLNYAIIELLLEKIAQKPFEEILKEELLLPFNMTNTFVATNDSTQVVQGYSIAQQKTELWKFNAFAASEGIKSCTADLMHLLKATLNIEKSPHQAIFEQLILPHQPTFINKETYSAKGWHIIKQKKYYNIFLISGNTSGYSTFMAGVKETQTGVIVLCNEPRKAAELGMQILRTMNNAWVKK